ncbi:MAG: TIR domain-containing protein [Candidatus Marinimicrobia bacterium]|nr:TIR domain-containing protein [Candidatus Neomarinimicrobiota bacterium]
MPEENKNIFISHIHEDDAGLNKLKELLASHGLFVRDYSIKADNPNNAHSEDYIKNQILAPRINKSGALVVYISPETKNSEYVDWEIEYAHKHDKRIVGVWAWGESGCEVPTALHKYAPTVVGWVGERIIDAINGKIDDWENPDGTISTPRQISRFKC